MNYDTYWKSLIRRVHTDHEQLIGDEDRFFRLSTVFGESMVDGIESYFERRFDQFEHDMLALKTSGFTDLAAQLERLCLLAFGTTNLTEHHVTAVVTELLDAPESPISIEITETYQRLLPRFDDLALYRDQLGLGAGFYDSVD